MLLWRSWGHKLFIVRFLPFYNSIMAKCLEAAPGIYNAAYWDCALRAAKEVGAFQISLK